MTKSGQVRYTKNEVVRDDSVGGFFLHFYFFNSQLSIFIFVGTKGLRLKVLCPLLSCRGRAQELQLMKVDSFRGQIQD